MAISLVTPPEYGNTTLAAFGVDKPLIELASSVGIKITSTSVGVFKINYEETLFGTIKVSAEVLKLAHLGKLGSTTKSVIRVQFASALKKGLAHLGKSLPSETEAPVAGFDIPKAFGVSIELIKEAKSKGLAIQGWSVDSFKVVHESKAYGVVPVVLGTVTVTPASFLLVESGLLAAHAKDGICMEFTKLLQAGLKMLKTTQPSQKIATENPEYEMLIALGVPSPLLVLAEDNGITVHNTKLGIFEVTHNGIVSGSVSVSGNSLKSLQQGKLVSYMKAKLRDQFITAIGKVLSTLNKVPSTKSKVAATDFFQGGTGTLSIKGSDGNPLMIGDVKDLTFTPPEKTKPANFVSSKYGASIGTIPTVKGPIHSGAMVSQDDMETMPVIGSKEFTIHSLDMATAEKKLAAFTAITPPDVSELYNNKKLYAAVKGTSSGSVYTVIAVFESVSLAVRVHGTNISFRLEGPALNHAAKVLDCLGFEKKGKDNGLGKYLSCHYKIGAGEIKGETLRKAYGAIVGLLGLDKALKLADIAKVKKVS